MVLASHKGFDRTTIQDISKACGIAPGLIYHYFPSKKDLLSSVLRRYSFLDELKKILRETKGSDPEATFIRIARRYWETLESRKEFFLMVFSEMLRNRKVADLIGQMVQTSRSLLLRYLSRMKRQGLIARDAPDDLFLRVFFSSLMMMFVAQHRLMPPSPGARFPDQLEQFVTLLFKGIARPRGPTERPNARPTSRKER